MCRGRVAVALAGLALGGFGATSRPAEGQRLRLDGQPLARVPVPGQEEFGSLVGAIVYDDGGFVLADAAYRRIRFFDRRGQERFKAGRQGSGPGEFEQIVWIGQCAGDSVYVFDPELSRVTVLQPTGAPVRSFRLASGDGKPAWAVRCNRTGNLLVIGWPRFVPGLKEGPYRATQTAWLTDLRGSHRQPIGEFAGGERYRYATSDGPRIFGKAVVAAVGNERLWIGEADSFLVAALDFQGRHTGALRRRLEPVPITRADIEAYQKEHLATVRDPGARRSQAAGFATYQFPATFPPYSDLLIDPFGLVWVRKYFTPTAKHDAWVVFHASGAFLQEFTLPPGVELLAVGGGHVLGRVTGPVGAHEAVLFRLVRAEPE